MGVGWRVQIGRARRVTGGMWQAPTDKALNDTVIQNAWYVFCVESAVLGELAVINRPCLPQKDYDRVEQLHKITNQYF